MALKNSAGSVELAVSGPPRDSRATERTDAELLRLFAEAGRQRAFAELVRRHGPMVLGVCRRSLHSRQDAEDAFQVTFLVLAKKAASIKDPALLANWLYGVAYRVAAKARAINARRHAMLNRLILMRTAKAQSEPPAPELEARLDQEINHLPAKYRAAIVACYLEGKSNRQAARDLGWPEGTLVTRLNRAKEMLRRRLSDGERLLSASVLGGTLSRHLTCAVHPALVASTSKAATAFALGAHATAVLSHHAALLTRIALRGALSAQAKVVAVALLTFAGAAAIVAADRSAGATFPLRPTHAATDIHPGAWPATLAPSDYVSLLDAPVPDSALRGPMQQARQTVSAATHANYGVTQPAKR